MASPVANFSGLASSIDWNSIVDQLTAVDEARNVTPLTNEIEKRTAQKAAWTTFQGLTDKLNDSARTLRAGGIGGYLATAGVSAATSRSLLSATASSTATPGNYKVEVLQLAQAAKLSGSAIASSTTAMGFTGDFALNGTTINVSATDTLADVRTRINDANTGATPTGVTATILSNGTGGGRLVLTRDSPGGSGINLTEGAGGLAREFGFVDSRSKSVSSTTAAIASALGLVVIPPPATMRVNGQTISVDLSVDSIATVVAKINAAGGQASVEPSANGDTTGFQISADGNVTADPNDTNSQAVIDALGFAAGTHTAVRQSVTTQGFTNGANATATASTLLTDLKFGGVAAGLVAGDSINVRGVRGDGSVVTTGVTIDPGETMQTLLDKLNDASTGYGAGSRPASAVLGADGAIHLTDNAGGDSRLSMSLTAVKANSASTPFATSSVTSIGRQREVSKSQDAELRVDGVLLSRASNSISDAIAGVTLSLQNAEPGEVIDVAVSKDQASAVKSIQSFSDAYNNVIKFFEEQRVSTAPLYGNSSLRSTISSFTQSLRTTVPSNATYNTLSVMGLALNRFGQLDANATTIKAALDSKPSEVEALFGLTGVGGAFVTATDNATRFGTGVISTQTVSIDESVRKLRTRADEQTRRVELRRLDLVARYSQMESTLSALNGTKNYLTSAIASMQSS
ncbi:MAG: flagellar filament capping protein FliD [Phycisphaerae bacterium]|nr:flagellar filament capping protein FliD [Gemmatimonadaceae bacterium]